MGWKLVIIDKRVWFKHEIGWFIDDKCACYVPWKWGHPKPYKFTSLHKFECCQRCRFNHKCELD